MTGYRFVPIDHRVVSPPVPFEALRLDKPHEEGSISGTLEVKWVAETPVCVGHSSDQHSKNANGDAAPCVRPLAIYDSDRKVKRGVLPGSSLRGMLRTVMEIATFSHLGRINDHRHFGTRHLQMQKGEIKANDIQSGWLTYCFTKKTWALRVAGRRGDIYPIRICDVLATIKDGIKYDDDQWDKLLKDCLNKKEQDVLRNDFDQVKGNENGKWGLLNVAQKRRIFAKIQKDFPDKKELHMLRKVNFMLDGGYNKNRGKFNPTTGLPGNSYLIVGGKDNENKRQNEVFVEPPKKSHTHTLCKEFMNTFNRINSNNVNGDWPEPTGLWRYWLGQMKYTNFFSQKGDGKDMDPEPQIEGCEFPGIPVFFCGDPKKAEKPASAKEFFMGLSRVLKVPHKKSVGDVAGQLYGGNGSYRVPPLVEVFDFARALFGWIEKPEDQGSVQDNVKIKALAGRVAISPAFTEKEPTFTEKKKFVLGSPRESFHRYYLKDGDYNSEKACPVGRKRYPVRKKITENGGDATESTRTTVMFHKPGTVYSGKIRVHNLHPVEMGALVWCLSFGNLDKPMCHSIGRCKGFGYGSLKLESLEWGKESSRTFKKNLPDDLVDSNERPDLNKLAGKFEEYMARELKLTDREGFRNNNTIQKLRGYANPKFANDKNLDYPPVEKFENIREPLGKSEEWG